MLQQFQLPPRPPFQRKLLALTLDEPTAAGKNKGHNKSFSEGSLLEDQPAWLDDLLSDSDSNTQGAFHSRSSSDPMASLYHHDNGDEDNDDESSYTDRSHDGVFESACVFQQGLRSHESASANSLNVEPKEGKRHPRQRSRVRKLHYIAQLDTTVKDLQVFILELQHKCSALLQENLTLSMENAKLKQQATKLQQQKLVLNSEYQTLRREAERLKLRLAYHDNPLIHPRLSHNHVKATHASWEMLNWGNLNFS